MRFSDALSQAMALPTGSYYTPKLAHIKRAEVTLVNMGGTARTNSSSESPVIGTVAFNPCCAILLYNSKTKTAVVNHQPFPHENEIRRLLSLVRKSEDEHVDMHAIGGPIYTKGSEKDISRLRKVRIDNLETIIGSINSSPNVTLKTFDVYDKQKPHAVVIDSRNGNLIRGSKLYKTFEEAEMSIMRGSDMFSDCHCLSQDKNFDGTISELQSQKKRP